MSRGKGKETVVIVVDWKSKRTMTNWFDSPQIADEFATDMNDGTPTISVLVKERPEVQG